MLIDSLRFANIDGDGTDDYVWLGLVTGAPTVYTNYGYNTDDKAFRYPWVLLNDGKPIASGAAPWDDYIMLNKKGGITIYRNTFLNPSKEHSWKPLPKADAKGISQQPEEISFHNINRQDYSPHLYSVTIYYSDRKADYI
ncbi:hypothetical protein LZ31DRAFT_597822 [Colletotrichum somersetense]|nr:hypothetical protein LZ31DRAFT_597822 [Colletotrichum somersetense]